MKERDPNRPYAGLDAWLPDRHPSRPLFGLDRSTVPVRLSDAPLPHRKLLARLRDAWRGLVNGWRGAL